MIAMPPVVVLIVCKTLLASPQTDNDKLTGYQDRAWMTENSMMVCRRDEVLVFNPDEKAPWTQAVCIREAVRLGAEFDITHANTPYRVWRIGCPTPTINTITGEIIAWTLPPCPHRDIAVCYNDTVI